MSLRGFGAIVLLVAGIAIERSSYYGFQSLLLPYLTTHVGTTNASRSTLMMLLTWGTLFATLGGGGLAIVMGPRITAAVGAFLTALGALAFAAHVPPAIGLLLVALGTGFTRPTSFAAAAEILAEEDRMASGELAAPSARRFAGVTAIAMALYCASNLGASASGIGTGMLRDTAGAAAVFGGWGAFGLLGAISLGGVALLARRTVRAPAASAADPYRTAPAAAAPQPQPSDRAFVGLGILLGAAAIFSIAVDFSTPFVGSASARDLGLLFAINSIVVTAITAVLCGLFSSFAMLRVSVPPLLVAAIGLAVFALGLVPSAVADSFTMAALGSFIVAVGEGSAGPVFNSYTALAWRPRFGALVTASFFFVTSMAAQLARAVAPMDARAPVLFLLALLLLASGVVGAIFARRLHRLFEPTYSKATS